METGYIRCHNCGAINKIVREKLALHPSCGKCHATLALPDKPVDGTDAGFTREVFNWPGVVLVEFWAPG